MMRALIAIDGSAGADLAVELASNLAWPDGSELHILAVLPEDRPPISATAIGPWEDSAPVRMHERVAGAMDQILQSAQRRLEATGQTVNAEALEGRPATTIAAEAESWPADVIIMGSRGHGPIASLIMGSVSAEVVDHAHCPVLVARTPRPERILLATDGMEGAAAAVDLLTRWHPQPHVEVVALSVAQVEAPLLAGIAPRMRVTSPGVYETAREQALEVARRLAHDARDRLGAAGIRARSDVREGHPSSEIVAAAREWPADLVVVGTRGHTGLARLILGSTARNVLVAAPCSVLIVKRPEGDQQPQGT
jgi:nucleotide-binding universal stress UspA family protein